MKRPTPRCTCCGQTIKAPRAPQQTADPIETATLSPSALMAYYKKRAPADDCAFIVRIFPQLASLVPVKPTKADAYRLFDAARHLLTPQPVRDEAAFWAHSRQQSQAWRDGVPVNSQHYRTVEQEQESELAS